MEKEVNKEEFDGQTVFYKSSEDMNDIPSNSIDVIITSPPSMDRLTQVIH
ncbi:MAG: hypothetical protein ACXAEU_13845 [Candidatus Hodarchaeales archaeon]